MTDVTTGKHHLELSVFSDLALLRPRARSARAGGWRRDDLIETAQLVISELVSNAIKAHASSPAVRRRRHMRVRPHLDGPVPGRGGSRAARLGREPYPTRPQSPRSGRRRWARSLPRRPACEELGLLPAGFGRKDRRCTWGGPSPWAVTAGI